MDNLKMIFKSYFSDIGAYKPIAKGDRIQTPICAEIHGGITESENKEVLIKENDTTPYYEFNNVKLERIFDSGDESPMALLFGTGEYSFFSIIRHRENFQVGKNYSFKCDLCFPTRFPAGALYYYFPQSIIMLQYEIMSIKEAKLEKSTFFDPDDGEKMEYTFLELLGDEVFSEVDTTKYSSDDTYIYTVELRPLQIEEYSRVYQTHLIY